MSKIITMPQLGETVTEGTVLSWLVKAGDVVSEDDPILEISTDKVDTEVPSPFSGTVTALLVEEGETVAVGANLLELDGDSQDIVETPSEVPEPEIQEEPEIVENETGEEKKFKTPETNCFGPQPVEWGFGCWFDVPAGTKPNKCVKISIKRKKLVGTYLLTLNLTKPNPNPKPH